jgi:hypothetical protein
MNTRHSLLAAALLIVFGAVAPRAASAEPAEPAASPPGTLQVQVNIPPSWRPMFEDQITEAFFSYIAHVFRREGYTGEMVEVRRFDEPSPGCCLLTINLVEWRMNHAGNINCTFTANLQTERTTRHLGVFSGLSFRWMSGPGRFGLADAFESAAEDAIRDLHRSLARTELVPGLRAR